MTSVPYPSFTELSKIEDRCFSAGVGRCRIAISSSPSTSPVSDDVREIYNKCVEQANVVIPEDCTKDQEKDLKQLQKKYMKQSVGLASKYLQETCRFDVSIVDVEVYISDIKDIVDTAGNYASCFLDAGCARIVLPYHSPTDNDASFQDMLNIAGIPRDRLMIQFTASWKDFNVSILEQLKDECHAVSLCVESDISPEVLSQILEMSKPIADMDVVVQIAADSTLGQFQGEDPLQKLTNLVGTVLKSATPKDRSGTTISLIDPTPEQLGLSYAACITTDRADGLFTTVVCTRSGEALGLVYSSPASIVASLQCGRGVYYSRSRNGLWRKGDTSGHFQTLHRIDVDCDGDALRFIVTQNSPSSSADGPNAPTVEAAFCHLETLTCWGAPRGIRHLEATLRDRLHNAPAGSYTQRLFQDPILLRNKLVEEAQELSEADTKQHVAEELADVLYFSLVRAAQFGIGLEDAVKELDRRARKVTRRAGDSKVERIAAADSILTQQQQNPPPGDSTQGAAN
jgi:phosphoribosyl-ATP pyrophosphohydrolase / phosphoribosyl-AMP cyclohydrolase / histidinol dehydrogenase